MSNDSDNQLVVLVLVVLAALFVLPGLGMGFGMGGLSGFGHMGGTTVGGMWGTATPWWMLLVGLVVQFSLLAALVVAGYLGYRALTDSTPDDAALEELRRAYARGDLTDEEFERRRERLTDD
jgi:putative membrane protein